MHLESTTAERIVIVIITVTTIVDHVKHVLSLLVWSSIIIL